MSAAKKLQLPWRSFGLLILIIPAVLLALLTYQLWLEYDATHRVLEHDRATKAENISKQSAEILNQIISEIQRQTDAAAELITQKTLHKIDASNSGELDAVANRLASLSVVCDNDEPAKKMNGVTPFKCSALSDAQLAKFAQPDANPSSLYVTQIYGSAVAFDKGIVESEGSALWSTYFYRMGDGLVHKNLNDIDYTNEKDSGTKWFHQILKDQQNGWANPYNDEAGDTYMITYSSIIKSGEDGKGIGVVTVDISINQLEIIIEKLIDGYDGFGALTFSNGLYLYHPERDYVKDGLTLKDVGLKKKDPNREIVAELAARGEGKTLSHVSTTTGEQSWLIVSPIKSSGWSLQNTFFKDSFYTEKDYDVRRSSEILLFSAVVLLTCWLYAIVCNFIGWSTIKLWGLSLLLSVMLIVGISNLWDLALNGTKPKNSTDESIRSMQTIENIKESYLSKLNGSRAHDDLIITVPTGIYIETIDLKDANVANISGRVWQVFKNVCNDACKINCDGRLIDTADCLDCKKTCKAKLNELENAGILFGRAKSVKLTELPRQINEEGSLVVSWVFQAEIASDFDHSRYPLEVEYLDVSIRSASSSNNVLLVPDVASYKFGSNRKTGLSKQMLVPGWEVFRTYFSLKKVDEAKPTFGMKQDFDKEAFNELHVKVGLKRIFVDAFISNLTPLIVVAIILFSVTLLPKNIDISRVLGVCVSVFFVIVFAHLAIRRNIATGEIFYLEYFFFTIYIALLLVPLDAFREALGVRNKILEFRNGLIYKVVYWPSVLCAFYVVTAFKFY